jgi:hypothetical protein
VALANIGLGNKAAMVAAGAMQQLVALQRGGSEKSREHAATALQNLKADNELILFRVFRIFLRALGISPSIFVIRRDL